MSRSFEPLATRSGSALENGLHQRVCGRMRAQAKEEHKNLKPTEVMSLVSPAPLILCACVHGKATLPYAALLQCTLDQRSTRDLQQPSLRCHCFERQPTRSVVARSSPANGKDSPRLGSRHEQSRALALL